MRAVPVVANDFTVMTVSSALLAPSGTLNRVRAVLNIFMFGAILICAGWFASVASPGSTLQTLSASFAFLRTTDSIAAAKEKGGTTSVRDIFPGPPAAALGAEVVAPTTVEVDRCLTRGSWLRGPDVRPPWHYTVPSGGWCTRQGRPWKNWVWTPAHNSTACALTMAALASAASTRERACEILAGHRVLFVGDSTQDSMYRVLMYRVEPKRALADYHWVESLGFGLGFATVCEGRAEVGFARNDHLVTCEGARGGDDAQCSSDNDAMGFKTHPGNAIQFLDDMANATVVVMNRGAHDTMPLHEFGNSPAVEITRHLTQQMTRLAKQIKRRGPWGGTRRFFWRSTPTGHWGIPVCNYTTPGPPNMTGVPKNYHWEYFAPHEVIKQRILREELGEALEMVDAAKYAYERRDMHIGRMKGNAEGNDCLHYCEPGPPDYFVSVFLLKLSRSAPPLK